MQRLVEDLVIVMQGCDLGGKTGLAVDQQRPDDVVLALMVVLDRDEEVGVPTSQPARLVTIVDEGCESSEPRRVTAHCRVDGTEAIEEGRQRHRRLGAGECGGWMHLGISFCYS